ncbi:hypothetical protein B4Q13_20725, partial [Lacticaseibacillus rhamnosus]
MFGLIGLALYLPACWAWHTHHLNFIVPLIMSYILLYPAFYVCVSTTSKVAVMPLGSKKRVEKLRYLVGWRNAIKLYVFYFIRL